MKSFVQRANAGFWEFFLGGSATRNWLRITVFCVLVVLMLLQLIKKDAATETVNEIQQRATVTMMRAADMYADTGAHYIGTVRAVSEAQITADVSGRITAVPVSLGQEVSAGQIIARLENSVQAASLLQAEGAYETALASQSQGDASVKTAEVALVQAETTAANTYRSAYVTVSEILLDMVDIGFNNGDTQRPSLRIAVANSEKYTVLADRAALNSSLEAWQAAISTNSETLTDIAETTTETTTTLVNQLLTAARNEANEGSTFSGTTNEDYKDALLTAQAALFNVQNTYATNQKSIEQATENLKVSRLANSGAIDSVTSASVKQALGVLRTAQANYEKTILRSPIAGTITTLTATPGDYLAAFSSIGLVANNNSFEITLGIPERDITQFVVGQTVRIDEAHSGIVTEIAPGLDPVTQKVQVTISTESAALFNGATVLVALDATSTSPINSGANAILVPITAVKFTVTDGAIFTITDDNKLVSNPVTLGNINGSVIEILSGITATTTFVADARGLNEGEAVRFITDSK